MSSCVPTLAVLKIALKRQWVNMLLMNKFVFYMRWFVYSFLCCFIKEHKCQYIKENAKKKTEGRYGYYARYGLPFKNVVFLDSDT